ncbi:MAG: zinc-dependent metalloprotease, partial [Myxococcota bacterium]|nr:zinc-dependent metalloprotease [Myxococcota bacterium]
MITMKTKVSLVLAASALLVTGCAQQQDEINRVQPNYTQKSELKGEFYFRSTVVEAPYTSLGFFVGNQNYQLERGIFDIQEDNLYFYRTYELMIGGETLGSTPEVDTPLYQTDDSGNFILDDNGKPIPVVYQRRVGNELLTFQRFVYRGSPILVIPITSHFDIQREFNTLTGEKTNVVVENTTDREWHERKYMRVGWGRSQFDHADRNIFPQQGMYGAFAPPSEVIDETYADGDRPVKELAEDGTIQYLDYQVRSVFAAPTAYLDGYGTIPACWYYPWYLGQVAECISERVTFRHSFLKVADSDYVAWNYPDDKLKKFAYYRMERAQYDAVRGTTFTGVSRRIRRFRIWENYVVARGEACEVSTTGDAAGSCSAGQFCESFDDGSFCVANDANDRLDYSQMTPKPIVWYLSEGFPRELVVQAMGLANSWSVPFADVVNTRKPDAAVSDMFVMCENNLGEAGEAMAALGLDINNAADVEQAQAAGQLAMIGAPCERMDDRKRNGDLRYSQLHAIVEPISYGLLGYGPSSADPMSGEMISGNSYMYMGAMKRQANMGMVAIEIMTGIRNFWETTYGNYISEKLQKQRLGAATGGLPSYSVDSARAVAKTMLSEDVSRRVDTMGIPTTDGDWAADRMAVLARNAPEIAKMFVTDDVKLLRKDPTLGTATSETTEDTLDRIGLHTWGNFNGHVSDMENAINLTGADGCRFMAEFSDPAILGLAREYSSRVNEYVCQQTQELTDSADGASVFDFQEFEQLQGACETENAESEDGLYLCQNIVLDDGGTTGLYWTNPCTVGKLKVQLAEAVVELEQCTPYNFTQDYFPPDPVYTDTKHQVVNDSQLVLLNAIDEIRSQIVSELVGRIFRGVAEHEVGHSIGLRHNFEGSTDALNFGEDYWKLKGQFDDAGEFQAYDMFAPETYYQSKNGLRQLQSASVMDYSAKFNDRFSGVGYYDRAAIRYGYGGLVEVFNSDPNVAKFDAYMENPQTADPNNVPVLPDIGSTYIERMFKRVHYTNIPELFPNDLSKLYDRSLVPASSISESGRDVSGRWEVPYRMCSDELAGKLPTCERWDSGVDSYEIVRNTLLDYEQYWPIYGYWHDSVLFQADGYYNRVVRMFQMLKSQMQWWVVQRNWFNHNDWWKNRF